MKEVSKILTQRNIILVSPLPPPIGGIASWTESFVNYCNKNDIPCTVVNSSVAEKRANSSKVSYLEEWKRLRRIRSELRQAVRQQKDCVIHYNASCFTAGLIRDYLVLKGINTPVVYQCHCNLDTNLNNKIASFMFQKVCNTVKTVCVLNSASRQTASLYHKNVKYIPNFIDELYREVADANGKIKNVCFVGRVCTSKGILEYIEAGKARTDLQFHIVGPIEDSISSLCDTDNFKIWGAQPHEKVIEILKEMDVYVLPSYTEGFPLGVLEAMSCGLPVIATDVGSISDMIENQGGILIPQKSSDAIVSALNEMDSSDVRQKMAEFNIAKVRNEYLIEKVIAQLRETYDSF